MSVSVNFEYLDNQTYLTEEELLASEDKLESFKNNYPQDGRLVISADGQPDVEIEDELWVLILHYGFKATNKLQQGENYEYKYFSMPGVVNITHQGNNVRIEGSYIQNAIFPKDDLIKALAACGQRFVDLIERWKDEEPYKAVFKELGGAI